MERGVKHRVKTEPINRSKESPTAVVGDNAKVRVQYIRNHHIVDKSEQFVQSTDEVENVEYLDESTSEDFPTASNEVTAENVDFKDTFYPNAVQCLLSLYNDKYKQMSKMSTEQLKDMPVWQEIAKEMSQRYFEFSSEQVRQKFVELRRQYFNVASMEDIEDFEYFEQLHEIYKDKFIDNITRSDGTLRIAVFCKKVKYADDVLINEETPVAAVDVSARCTNNEMVHKEHEFVDMVEKELQAMEDSEDMVKISSFASPMKKPKPSKNASDLSCEKEHLQEGLEVLPTGDMQTLYVKQEVSEGGTVCTLPAVPKKSKEPSMRQRTSQLPCSEHDPSSTESPIEPIVIQTSSDFSLADFNDHQERRHQDKMQLLRQFLQLQERAVEVQSQLLKELIKRWPS